MAQPKSAAGAGNLAETEHPSLTVVRSLKAGPEKVWQALTEPALLGQWMGPSDEFRTLAETDLRVGGRYRFLMRGPNGAEHDVGGTYLEIVPNRRLVYTWAWKSTPERESRVTVELRPAGEGTQLTLCHEQFHDEEARTQHEQGWNGCLARLEKLV